VGAQAHDLRVAAEQLTRSTNRLIEVKVHDDVEAQRTVGAFFARSSGIGVTERDSSGNAPTAADSPRR
jgi:hypothetical protein